MYQAFRSQNGHAHNTSDRPPWFTSYGSRELGAITNTADDAKLCKLVSEFIGISRDKLSTEFIVWKTSDERKLVFAMVLCLRQNHALRVDADGLNISACADFKLH